MNILHTVEAYTPSVNGMQEAVRRVSEYLAAAGHQVTVATSHHPGRHTDLINGVRVRSFAIAGGAVQGLWAEYGETERYRKLLLSGGFDVIVNFAAQQWATDLALNLIGELEAARVLVPTGFSGLYDPAFCAYYRAMAGYMKQYDMNVFLSEEYRDTRFALENGINRYTIIPNGASLEEFETLPSTPVLERLRIRPEDFLVLSVGSHTGLKGHRETLEIFRSADIRKAVLVIAANAEDTICGRRCRRHARRFGWFPAQRWRQKKVRVGSFNRADLLSLYRRADTFLFPSNLECSPIVLFESAASATPFLASAAGNSGEIARWTGCGRILPGTQEKDGLTRVDIGASAAILSEWFRNPGLRKRLGETGREQWRRTFTWESIGARYEALYRDLVSTRGVNT